MLALRERLQYRLPCSLSALLIGERRHVYFGPYHAVDDGKSRIRVWRDGLRRIEAYREVELLIAHDREQIVDRVVERSLGLSGLRHFKPSRFLPKAESDGRTFLPINYQGPDPLAPHQSTLHSDPERSKVWRKDRTLAMRRAGGVPSHMAPVAPGRPRLVEPSCRRVRRAAG